jgi:acyl-CoA oxidase
MMFFCKPRFGTFLGLAHAAMTAEGDNSVLMQKVAKERLGILAKQPLQVQRPASSSIEDTEYLLYLIRSRELNLFNELGRKMLFIFSSILFLSQLSEEFVE